MPKYIPNKKDFYRYMSIRNAVLVFCHMGLDESRKYTDDLFKEMMVSGKAVIPAEKNSAKVDLIFKKVD